MNVIGASLVAAGPIPPVVTRPSTPDRPLHRLCEVRQQEGLTRRQVAGRMGVSLGEVQRQEQSSSDLRLSDLHRWQQALAVPIAELLDEPEGALSPPVRLRARLFRIMKTVRSIQQRTRQAPMQRLVETLVAQLVEVMPELTDATAWPTASRRRGRREPGQAFFRRLSLDPWDELEGPES